MRATKIRATFVSIITIFIAGATASEVPKQNRVAVIDTGLDIKSNYYKPFLCKSGHKDFTGTGIQDDDGHGTQIVNLIIKNSHSDNFCLVIYKFYSRKNKFQYAFALLNALNEVSYKDIKLVNLSLSGKGYLKNEDEYFYQNPSITFVTAAGNDGVNLDEDPRYPASYDHKNILVVGALDKHSGQKLNISNYGKRVTHWEKADATSFATAIKTGKIIKERFGRADGLF